MGKRLRRGGRSPSSSSACVLDRKILRRRILSLKLDASFDVDAVAAHLRSHYPDYARTKAQPFANRVGETLESLHGSLPPPSYDEGDSEAGDQSPSPPSHKKTNRASESEQRLLRAEAEHLRRQKRRLQQADPSDASVSTSTSQSDDEDAIFEAKVEPEFDLMKSMLRDNYGKKSMPLKPAKSGQEDDNMEIDVSNEKKRLVMGPTDEKKGESMGKGAVRERKEVRFKDLGGMKKVLEELMDEVVVPFYHPELPKIFGVQPITGILLHGPPGCGKTTLAQAIANETGAPFYPISATDVVSGISGQSEEQIRDLFKKAHRTAPSIVFIDEIDAIASKRENLQREMERRIVTQLMVCMDESHQALRSTSDPESETPGKKSGFVLVIGATNRPDAVDQALRRPGRFDREISLGTPDENARLEILSVVITRLRKFKGEIDLKKIARSTPGFVGADLEALVNKAGNLAMKRAIDKRKSEFRGDSIDDWWRDPWPPEVIENSGTAMSDLEDAAKLVQPSLTREGFSSIPSSTWEDVGGLDSLKKEFNRYIVQRIRNPEVYEELGVNMEVGLLLYGPPGCGKTLIAKAVANEAGINFIHIKGPEILAKFVGESEQSIRTIFSRARTCSPCIVFFDEVDALTTTRGREGAWVVERLLNQLLIELDGADQRQGVYVIGATNRLEVMDPAVLRPGRFGRILYVPLPTADERGMILKALARKKLVAANIDWEAIGNLEACHNLSGADLRSAMEKAAVAVCEEKLLALENGSVKDRVIEISDVEKALLETPPSVSEKHRVHYEILAKSHGAA